MTYLNFSSLFGYFSFILCLALFSCQKQEVGPQGGDEGTVPGAFSKGVFILNEGNFGTNNGSISFYTPSGKQIDNAVYQSANGGKKLGDVVQSMTIINNKGFIVVNNSQKIEVVEMEDLKRIATIEGFKSPRYLLPVSSATAFVTNFVLDLPESRIDVVSLTSNQIIGSVSTNGWTEGMVFVKGQLFVANVALNKILVIDTLNYQVKEEIDVNNEPHNLVVDGNGMIWVLCTGGIKEGLPGLLCIDPVNKKIVKKIEDFTIEESPSNLCINSTGDTLYFLNNNLYRMPLNADHIPAVPLIELTDFQYPYGLLVDPLANDIYISDALDFQQNGWVNRYSRSGKLLDRFQAGEGPAFMLFSE